jgi:hypothetical protein
MLDVPVGLAAGPLVGSRAGVFAEPDAADGPVGTVIGRDEELLAEVLLMGTGRIGRFPPVPAGVPPVPPPEVGADGCAGPVCDTPGGNIDGTDCVEDGV